MTEDTSDIVDILLDFRGTKVIDFCRREVAEGMDPYDVFKKLTRGLDKIGRGYENKEFKKYFESDLIVSGGNMKKAIDLLKPRFEEGDKARGKVVIGTVKGDVHDIGKSIVSIMLESNGFSVIDLGVDVSKEIFSAKVKEAKPDILAMSALLYSTMPYMEEVIKALEAEGLRDKVKVVVGGRPVTQEYADKIGADAYGADAVDGLKTCLRLIDVDRR